ncbi:Protein of unknown function [Gryllus bimaculatus]|nr:Protein of unknown function [Gryllus bimaculatus]
MKSDTLTSPSDRPLESDQSPSPLAHVFPERSGTAAAAAAAAAADCGGRQRVSEMRQRRRGAAQRSGHARARGKERVA